MATHPPATTAPGGADPVKDLTDGAKQLEINQKDNAAAPGASKQKQPKAQQAKKDKKQQGAGAGGESSRPIEVSIRIAAHMRPG